MFPFENHMLFDYCFQDVSTPVICDTKAFQCLSCYSGNYLAKVQDIQVPLSLSRTMLSTVSSIGDFPSSALSGCQVLSIISCTEGMKGCCTMSCIAPYDSSLLAPANSTRNAPPLWLDTLSTLNSCTGCSGKNRCLQMPEPTDLQAQQPTLVLFSLALASAIEFLGNCISTAT